MKTIGERLKEARESLKMDQAQFADDIGVASRDTISRWERGKNYPPADILALMYEKYGISADWLITGEGDMMADQGERLPPGALDRDLMKQVIWGLESSLQKRKLTLDPEKKADLILLLYDYFFRSETDVSDEVVQQYLRLVS